MTKQELLEAFSCYLPYEVKCLINRHTQDVLTLECLFNHSGRMITSGYTEDGDGCSSPLIEEVKLILHPISEFIHNPEKYQEIRDNMSECEFESLRDSFVEFPCKNKLDHVSYSTVTSLIKNHFDVFGLIELGYAFDINTINNGQV